MEQRDTSNITDSDDELLSTLMDRTFGNMSTLPQHPQLQDEPQSQVPDDKRTPQCSDEPSSQSRNEDFFSQLHKDDHDDTIHYGSDNNDVSDDDQPLSKLRDTLIKENLKLPLANRRKRRKVKKRRYSSDDHDNVDHYDTDDSTKDPSFKVKKADLLSSDDSDVSIINTVKSNVAKPNSKLKSYKHSYKRRNGIRHDTSKKTNNMTRAQRQLQTSKHPRSVGWRKKPSTLNNRQKNTPGRPNMKELGNSKTAKKQLFPRRQTINDNLTMVKRRSMIAFRARTLVLKAHTESLDSLLASNGLQRKTIQGDGDCFFRALQVNVKDTDTQSELRNKLCDHLVANKEEYIGFLTKSPDVTDEDMNSVYNNQVVSLRTSGQWSCHLADALPLAAANVLKRDIIIYSSNRNRPVLKIKPTMCGGIGDSLLLAHFSIPGFEHYDACEPLDESKNVLPNVSTLETESIPEKQSSPETITDDLRNHSHPTITPRKQANYRSPKQKFRSRKRISKPETWKKNIRKKLKLSGQEYTSVSGKTVPAKQMIDIDCTKCRYKCSVNISNEERKTIFTQYWSLRDYKRQRDYLCNTIVETCPSRIRTNAKTRRKMSRIFSFIVNDKQIRVCKQFYIKTLAVGQKTIDYALKGKVSGVFSTDDNRGNHIPGNKTPDVSLNHVRSHIESFPLMDPHYTRKDTNRKFLGSNLNITTMYNCYKEECNKANRKPVGPARYRKVFCEEYNYSFHIPKKDQCRICNTYQQENEKGAVSDEMKTLYDQHISRKLRARQEKEFDKEFAKKTVHYHTATFDLQAVLNTPCSNVSQVYYKRKLNCYNLCVYSLEDKKASCYMWNETEAKRGSNEIASCLVRYINSLPPITKHVCLFSDSCTGQNKNRNVAVALLHAVSSVSNIETIDQKYLEPGHTEMEVDSMHAAIETAKKRTSVYVPSQWDTIVRMARKNKPYTVVPLKFSDIGDFKTVADKCIPASCTDTRGKRVKWMEMKWIQFRKRDPNTLYFKYDFDEEEFHCLRMKSSTRNCPYNISGEIPRCYEGKSTISEAKKKDLIALCNDNTIPREYHTYYQNLSSSKDVRDCVPEPDLYDDMCDTDED